MVAFGGIERIISFKANYFAEHFDNYDVTIITSDQMKVPPYYPLSKKVHHIDIDIPMDRPNNPSRIRKLLTYPYKFYIFKKRLSKLIYELHPDIFISTMRRELNFINDLDDGSVKIGEFHVTRYAYGSEAINSNNFLWKYLKKHWANKFVFNMSKLKKVVLLTHEEAGFWPELQNIVIIPNPIVNYHAGSKSTCLSKKVIAVGRYADQKGFDMLIPAWKLVIEKHPDWILQIFGNGGLRQSLHEQIDGLGLQSNCFLPMPVSNIHDKYSESSIFVLSSRYEGFGMVITEAMSCGLPVVSFSCACGPKDIISDGKDGFLVEPENIEQLAEKITFLIENEDRRVAMGQCAFEKSKTYMMENISKDWLRLFDSLLANS